MKRFVLSFGVLVGLASLSLSLRAAEPVKTEVLAGEDDKAVPTALPTPAADSRGPLNVTRSAQGAPAFQLPDFVVTGSGERKALARRDGQNGGLDTSGGLKASPGEKGAGKDQMEAKAERSSAEDKTYTVRASDGWIRAAYGAANTAALDGGIGKAQGSWVWALQGGARTTDGGPVAAGLGLAQHRDAALKGNVSFDNGQSGLWEAELQGEGRARRWTRSTNGEAWLERDRSLATGDWSGGLLGAAATAEISGQRASLRLPGLGTAYSEEGGKLSLGIEKAFNGHTGSTTLLADGSVEALSQRGSGQRQLLVWDAALRSRFEPFSKARLTLGLGLDAVTGDDNALLLGPRVEWQQRFSPAWGFNARFSSGLDISRLQSSAWEQDARVPNALLPVSRRTADLDAALLWQTTQSLSLEAGVFAKQDEGHFLPDDALQSGLWVDTPVRNYREIGAEAKQRWERDGLWQELGLRFLRPELTDLPGATPTFAPTWTGRLSAGGRRGAWYGWMAVDARSEEAARLRGTWTLPAAAALSAELGYDVSEALTVFAEGRNLTAAPWGDTPDDPDPAPYAGLGLEYRF